MNKTLFSALLVCTVVSAAVASKSAPAAVNASDRPAAKAELKNAKGEKIGMAEFYPVDGGVKMKVQIAGLTAGDKGIHIHEKGKCDAPDFKSAGGHLNPDKKHHGLKNAEGHHEGDLNNLSVNKEGVAKQEFELKGAELQGQGPHSLLPADGTAVVIHAKQDDEKSDPAGNAGDRIACGVIKAI